MDVCAKNTQLMSLKNANVALKSRHYSALSVNISTWVQQCSSVVIVLVGMYLIKKAICLWGFDCCVILSGRALSGRLHNVTI